MCSKQLILLSSVSVPASVFAWYIPHTDATFVVISFSLDP